MTNSQRCLLELVKASLHSGNPLIPPDVDWTEVYKEASSQAVASLTADALPPSVPEEIAEKWRLAAARRMAHYVRVLNEQENLIGLLSKKGIPLVILKGTAAAMYYPVPSKRTMGDIDFLVPQERFQETAELMEASGYRRDADYYNPRHAKLYKNNILLELHHHFSIYDLDLEPELIRALPNADAAELDGSAFPVLPPLENGLVLLGHLRQHLIDSVGLRQFIDWVMYCDRMLDDGFWRESFQPMAESYHLDTLAKAAAKIGRDYLGLRRDITWFEDADDALCEQLLELILENGNFGRKLGEGKKVENKIVMFKHEGFFHHLQKVGEGNWQALKAHPRLRPFAWVYQIGRYAVQLLQTKRTGKTLQEDLARGNEKYELLRGLDLIQ